MFWEVRVRFPCTWTSVLPADPNRSLSLQGTLGGLFPALLRSAPRPFSLSWWLWLTLTGVACACAVG